MATAAVMPRRRVALGELKPSRYNKINPNLQNGTLLYNFPIRDFSSIYIPKAHPLTLIDFSQPFPSKLRLFYQIQCPISQIQLLFHHQALL